MDPRSNPRLPRVPRDAQHAPHQGPPGASPCRAGEEFRLSAPPFATGGSAIRWEQVAGPAVDLSDPNDPEPVLRIPVGLVNSKIAFEAHAVAGDAAAHCVLLWVTPDEDSPAAEAGATQVVSEGDVVLLDGRGTRLPAGWSARDVAWEWVQVAGPPVALSDPWSLTPALRAPEGLVSSDVRFELHVTAGAEDGPRSISSVNLLVCSIEDALALESDTAPTAPAGDQVRLCARAETESPADLHWSWRQIAGAPVDIRAVPDGEPRFSTPSQWRNVRLAFEAKANDGQRTGSTRVEVLVEPDPEAPRVEIQDVPPAADGDLVCVEARLSGADAAQCSVRWVQLEGPPVRLVVDTDCALPTARVSFQAPDVAAARIHLACVASNGPLQAVDTVEVSILGDEDAPLVDAGSPQRVEAGAEVQLDGRACTEEGRPVRVLWRQTKGPRVALADPTSARTHFRAPHQGCGETPLSATLQFALHAFGDGLESVDTLSIHIGAADPLSPSRAGKRLEVTPGERIRLGEWSDSELAGVEDCAWRQVAGPQVLLMNERAPAAWFRAPEGYANTKLSFELDARIAGQRILETVEVLVEPDEDAPVALCAADLCVAPRELVRLAAFARDPNGLSLEARWRQTSGPPVELDDPGSLRPTFAAPSLEKGATLSFEFTVTDGVETVAETMRVFVLAADASPALLPPAA